MPYPVDTQPWAIPLVCWDATPSKVQRCQQPHLLASLNSLPYWIYWKLLDVASREKQNFAPHLQPSVKSTRFLLCCALVPHDHPKPQGPSFQLINSISANQLPFNSTSKLTNRTWAGSVWATSIDSASPKCRNVQKCASAANHNQPYFEEQVTLAENTLELKFKVLLKSIGSRHRKRMHHTLLRVEVNKLLFKLMQLFCANDLSVQQVQRNCQIITSNVNHGLVVFSGFDCNRLLPPLWLLAEKNVQGQDQRVQRSSKIQLRDLVHGTSSNHLQSDVFEILRVWDASNAQKGCVKCHLMC